jgi:hypothetical protein
MNQKQNPSTIKMKDFLNDNNRLVTENNFETNDKDLLKDFWQ